MESIEIPNSVKSIGDAAFQDCTSLENIEIPNSVTNIGEWAFYGCIELKNAKILGKKTIIANEAFSECKKVLVRCYKYSEVEKYVKANNIKYELMMDISEKDDETVIAELLEEGTLKISGKGKMKDFPNADVIPWADSKEKIKKVIVEEGVTNIGEKAFEGCGVLTEIEISKSVTEIKNSAFSDCKALINIDVDNNNKSYTSEDGIVFNKEKTKIVRYPSGKTESIYKIPKGVEIIESNAFGNCNTLIDIEISKTVTNIKSSAFFDCKKLININVDNDNENYTSEDGIVFNKEKTNIVRYPSGKTETTYKIPDKVEIIESDAFEGCQSLTEIKIPDKVTRIGIKAFSGCTRLEKVEILGRKTMIEREAFSGCEKVVIRCYKNSEAEKYAKANNIKYELIYEESLSNKIIPKTGKEIILLVGIGAFIGISVLCYKKYKIECKK